MSGIFPPGRAVNNPKPYMPEGRRRDFNVPHARSFKKIAAARPDIAAWRDAILAKLVYALGKTENNATGHDWFLATALAVRDRIIDR